MDMPNMNNELRQAIKDHNYGRVVELIDLGADVNGAHVFGTNLNHKWTHVYMAVNECIPHNSNESPIDHDDPRIRIIKYLILKGADINGMNGYLYWTPLYFAAKYGSFICVKLLLESGANSEIKNGLSDSDFVSELVSGSGQTAARGAKDEGHHMIAEFIESYNIDNLTKGVF